MSNLTKNQKDIIANLTNEFKALNTQCSDPSNLLDIGSLLQEMSNDKKRRAEILINNEAYAKKLRETTNGYVRQLRDLLYVANLHVWVKCIHDKHYQISIGTLLQYNNKYNWSEPLQISVRQNSKTTHFDSRIQCVDEYTDVCTMSFYFSGDYEIKNINSIKDLTENGYFIKRLKALIVLANQ
jgi:hypothetical protein